MCYVKRRRIPIIDSWYWEQQDTDVVELQISVKALKKNWEEAMLHLSRTCILSKTMSFLTSIAFGVHFLNEDTCAFQSCQSYSQWTSFESCFTKRPENIVRKEARMDTTIFGWRSLLQWQQYDARILRQRVLQIRQSRIATKRAFEYATLHDHTN